MAEKGWIKLYRQIQECEFLWDSKEEPFDRRSAWIDLLLMANHKDKRMMFRGKAITVGCGQRITSLHNLAARWHWGINRVRNYLDLLQGENMLVRESDNTKTLLTIVNYQKYQAFSDFEGTATDTVTDTVTNTPTDTVTDIAQIQSQIPNNNDKNDKNDKKNIYGEFGNVKLSDQERQKLIDEYGEILTNKAIKMVDEYCQQRGKKYKDYYLAIRKWGIDAAKKANGDERDEDPNLKLILQKIEKEGWA